MNSGAVVRGAGRQIVLALGSGLAALGVAGWLGVDRWMGPETARLAGGIRQLCEAIATRTPVPVETVQFAACFLIVFAALMVGLAVEGPMRERAGLGSGRRFMRPAGALSWIYAAALVAALLISRQVIGHWTALASIALLNLHMNNIVLALVGVWVLMVLYMVFRQVKSSAPRSALYTVLWLLVLWASASPWVRLLGVSTHGR